MLRITENLENGKIVRLRLDGAVTTDTLDELNEEISHYRNGTGRTVILDMAGVEFMNDHAAHALVMLRADDLRLINCSPFIATLLDTFAEGETRS
jgi:anti-anti-sigma regulatory factor